MALILSLKPNPSLLLFLSSINSYNDICGVSNIESDNYQNVGLEDYNNISDGIFQYFNTPSIKITRGYQELLDGRLRGQIVTI